MTAFVILVIIALNFLVVGFSLLKECFGIVCDMMSSSSSDDEKLSAQEILFAVIGFILAIVGAVLFYKVCAASVTDIILPHHPVENPVTYGIGAIISSLIFAGGMACTEVALEEKKYYKVIASIVVVVLIVYLILKNMLILH